MATERRMNAMNSCVFGEPHYGSLQNLVVNITGRCPDLFRSWQERMIPHVMTADDLHGTVTKVLRVG